MKKNIRGWGLEIGFSLFRRTIFINFMPLVWQRLLWVVADRALFKGAEQMYAPHFVFGPFHIWISSCGEAIGASLDITYNHFWWDVATVPSGYRRIL